VAAEHIRPAENFGCAAPARGLSKSRELRDRDRGGGHLEGRHLDTAQRPFAVLSASDAGPVFAHPELAPQRNHLAIQHCARAADRWALALSCALLA